MSVFPLQFNFANNNYRALLILLLLIAANNFAFSQVNTEALRKDNFNGFNFRIGFGTKFKSGNSESSQFSGGLRCDYLYNDIYTFCVLNSEYGDSKSGKFTNKGFVHLRTIFSLDKTYDIEAFTQEEYDEFILLNKRFLAGSGMRFNLINSVDSIQKSQKYLFSIGSGAMYEYEKINQDIDPISKTVRWTNYISLAYKPENNLRLILTSYYQPSLKDFKDFRILSDASLEVGITKSLKFLTKLVYRYDNQPPIGLKKYDLDLQNSLTLEF